MTKPGYVRFHELSVLVDGINQLSSDLPSLANSSINRIDLTINNGDKLWLDSDNPVSIDLLVRVLVGQILPTEGSLEVTGDIFPISKPLTSFISKATLEQNLVNRGLILGKSLAKSRKYATDVMRECELHSAAGKIFGNLPRDAQIAATLASLAHVKPRILVLQQWMKTANEQLAEIAEAKLIELVEQSEIVILCMNKPAMEGSLCNRKVILKKGEVASDIRMNTATNPRLSKK